MMPKSPLNRWLGLSIFLLITFWYFPHLTGYSITRNSPPTSFTGGQVDDGSWLQGVLKDNKIGPEIEYAQRTIRYVPDAKERLSMTKVQSNLFAEGLKNITIDKLASLPAGPLLDVHVKQSPRPDQVDASSLIFGASTTFARFQSEDTSPIKEFSRWLTNGHGQTNGAGLVLALLDASEVEIDTAAQTLATIGINATVIPSNPALDMPGRYVDLVRMLYTHPTHASRKYFVLIDDDTFFPCISHLMEVLSQYDPTKPYYIGTFTERADWLLSNGAPFAYGGGGIILTAPTAQKITELPCLDKNPEGKYILNADQGDRLLYNCLKTHTEITLTYLPELRQLDQFGDPSGIYESGTQHLSLHHYKSWHHFSPAPMHTVSDACGESCVLQRFQFLDNFIITNGYSVAHYPKGIDFDTESVEHTFDAGIPEDKDFEETTFGFVFGMLRKGLGGTGRKRGWGLLGARKEGDGRVKQVYLKRRDDKRWVGEGEQEPSRDSVVVLTWIP